MFKIMTSVLDKKKKPSLEEIRKIPPFIFLRWLSGSPMCIMAANLLNRYNNIPIENQYHLIKNVFGGKIKYIPYPKKTKIEALKHQEYLSTHFKISLEKAQEYLELISDEELKYIVDMYTDKKIKK